MNILKFGGASLDNSEHIRSAASIVGERRDAIVVLSAVGGTTDILTQAAAHAESGRRYEKDLQNLESLHLNIARALGVSEEGIQRLFRMMRDILLGVALIRECSMRSEDYFLGFGEWLICDIFTKYLVSQGVQIQHVNIAPAIVVDKSRGTVIFDKTYKNLQALLPPHSALRIVAGFVATTEDGEPTTLGRNGADYTASLIAAALDSRCIEIWTDKNGIYSANPEKVADAFIVKHIGSAEVMELSYFGAHIIHPLTIMPAMEKNIPIHIRNTFAPEESGTIIEHRLIPQPFLITGIASIDDIALINITGNGMVGVVGLSSRVFSALRDAGVNVIMITQASSEHSICIFCREEDQKKALQSLRHALQEDIQSKRIQQISQRENLEIVSVVGNNMCGQPGISGTLFHALGEEKINIIAIAQGSSETNISFVIDKKDSCRTLQTLHRTFFKTGKKE